MKSCEAASKTQIACSFLMNCSNAACVCVEWFACLARGNGTGNGIVSKCQCDRCMVLFAVCTAYSLGIDSIYWIEIEMGKSNDMTNAILLKY